MVCKIAPDRLPDRGKAEEGLDDPDVFPERIWIEPRNQTALRPKLDRARIHLHLRLNQSPDIIIGFDNFFFKAAIVGIEIADPVFIRMLSHLTLCIESFHP
jgi:hypothetical protein